MERRKVTRACTREAVKLGRDVAGRRPATASWATLHGMAVRYGIDDPALSDRVVMRPRLWRMRRALIIRSTEYLSGTAQPKHQSAARRRELYAQPVQFLWKRSCGTGHIHTSFSNSLECRMSQTIPMHAAAT